MPASGGSTPTGSLRLSRVTDSPLAAGSRASQSGHRSIPWEGSRSIPAEASTFPSRDRIGSGSRNPMARSRFSPGRRQPDLRTAAMAALPQSPPCGLPRSSLSIPQETSTSPRLRNPSSPCESVKSRPRVSSPLCSEARRPLWRLSMARVRAPHFSIRSRAWRAARAEISISVRHPQQVYSRLFGSAPMASSIPSPGLQETFRQSTAPEPYTSGRHPPSA
jgi:hypothetical protein